MVIKFLMAYVVPLFVLVPLVIGLRNYSQLQISGRLVVWYLFLSSIASLVAVTLGRNNINNMPVFHIFTIVEFVVLTLFFASLSQSKNLQSTLIVISILFLIFGVINAIFIQSILTYNSYSRSIGSLLLIVFGLHWFFNSLGSRNIIDSPKGLFWIISGIICYFSGGLFLFIFHEYVAQDPVSYRYAWLAHAIFVAAFLYTTITIFLIQSVTKWKLEQ